MIKLFRRWWGYLNAKLTGKFNEMADPTVQLEQAIREAQDQHRRLKEQAANVIASQKQAEMRLNKRMSDLEYAEHQRPPGADHGGRRPEDRRHRAGGPDDIGRRDHRQRSSSRSRRTSTT